jgi:valyl-tRNA synthetase
MLIDRWIMTKLQKTIKRVTQAMENCDFMNATEAARNYIWHIFCDHYLEAAKTRLYGEGNSKKAAQWTLFHIIRDMLKLMAPITPHLCEEIYRTMYNSKSSITLSNWPSYDVSQIDVEAERIGDIIISTISSIRTEKNRRGVSLNAPVEKLIIFTEKNETDLLLGAQDIKDTLKVDELEIIPEKGGEITIEGLETIGFTIIL